MLAAGAVLIEQRDPSLTLLIYVTAVTFTAGMLSGGLGSGRLDRP